MKSKGVQARSLYDYDANDPEEISLRRETLSISRAKTVRGGLAASTGESGAHFLKLCHP